MVFTKPNFTQIPNQYYDEIAPTLTDGENRVMGVIMRQTYGWGNKEWDRISLSQLAKKTGMQKKSVCRSLKTLIEKGHVRKYQTGRNGEQENWYSLAVEKSDFCDNSNNLDRCPKDTPPSVLKTPTKETITKEKEKVLRTKKKPDATPPPKSKSHSPSPKGRELAALLFSHLKQRNPDHKQPDLDAWAIDIDRMIEIDKRDPNKIEEIINWCQNKYNFWCKNIRSGYKLRKQFDVLVDEKNLAEDKNRIETNRQTAHRWKKDYPNHYRSLEIKSHCVINPRKGKDLSLDMDPQEFANRLEHLADGINV